MSKETNERESPAIKYSSLSDAGQEQALKACNELTDSFHAGLDLSNEIRAVQDQNLGETLLLWSGATLEGFAICYCGEGTEAGKDACYVKFAAARSGASAEKAFERLLDCCEALTAEQGLKRIVAGMNVGRSQAYRHMLQHGFRTDFQGVAMQKPDAPGYNRPDVFVVDDWR